MGDKSVKVQLRCIEGIKGVGACLIAFVWHYQHFSPQYGSPFYCFFAPFYEHGDRVVELFLLLSGFGMALGYEESILNGKISLGTYMYRRFVKFFPLMWITLFATTLLQGIYLYKTGVTFVYSNYDISHFLLNVFGVQNILLGATWSFNAPSWCISILLACYALFFCVVSGNRGKGRDCLLAKYVALSVI